jgi:phospholipase C
MASQQSAQVYITNSTDGHATITLYHNNSSNGTQSDTWAATPGQQVGPLTVPFETGFGSWGILDYWAVELAVADGSTPGVYESSGVLKYSDWKECQLQSADAGQTLVLAVNASTFWINLRSGSCTTPMNLVQRQTAQAYVTNATDGHATITLYHNNSSDGTHSGSWAANPGQQVGPLTVPFRVGLNSALILDYWAVELAVSDGSTPGLYQSAGFLNLTDWKECQLQGADAGRSLPLSVSSTSFTVNLASGGCQTPMNHVGPYTPVDHVFVLMLENHSFDNVFAMSGIPGITRATPANTNAYAGQSYAVASPAPPSMPTDPGHEFLDVLEQLCGQGATHTPWQPYPKPITNSGFVANYATTRTEIEKNNPNVPTPAQYGLIMECFDTPKQLPVIYQLATEFAVCDRWYASIPGPTWPNRFFVHGASSAGWADSPGSTSIVKWALPGGGFTYPSGSSIYDALAKAGRQWRVYVDENGPVFGGIPQVAALKGITYTVNTNPFSAFASDLQGPYPYTYTFIEPNYGDVSGGSYTGGSSQHPMDGVAGGEALLKAAYEAIRNCPLWNRSLLIIVYDEHGGFYDSSAPGPALPPDDGSPQDPAINANGFLFDNYGVRVPAVIISPLIPKGSVDHTPYDHTSVLATLERLYNIPPLTRRDAAANTVLGLLSLAAPRTDCPTTLNNPAPRAVATALATALARPPAPAAVADEPVPDSGNVTGFLDVLLKTDLELARGDAAEEAAINQRFGAIKTLSDAEAYADEVRGKARAARALSAQKPAPPSRVGTS